MNIERMAATLDCLSSELKDAYKAIDVLKSERDAARKDSAKLLEIAAIFNRWVNGGGTAHIAMDRIGHILGVPWT